MCDTPDADFDSKYSRRNVRTLHKTCIEIVRDDYDPCMFVLSSLLSRCPVLVFFFVFCVGCSATKSSSEQSFADVSVLLACDM